VRTELDVITGDFNRTWNGLTMGKPWASDGKQMPRYNVDRTLPYLGTNHSGDSLAVGEVHGATKVAVDMIGPGPDPIPDA
jgi:hypothetical protein